MSDGSVDDVSSNLSFGSSGDDDEEYRLLQAEWDESVRQLQQLVSIVLMPVLGKWMGRRWSQWAYARYIRVGLGKTFFLGERILALNAPKR